ncbi:hypothetical protein J2X97_002911 [Epilithonimonas hungarica]|uniref:hypothetical protein n=1 Tax=Epilithonimonas hungarica TaxID=454006 RepID=UPI0012CC8A29|nr:hypothetical protein [Epilithonimonas hungarica]MDP9957245.1 hypothetical protein [Epilithonimonas hungarica]MPT32548.1 hypothetical protein [Chryseobacterium sp.]
MKNILYYITIAFGIFTLSSCDPSQDANGDFLNGVDYTDGSSSGGSNNSTVKNIRKVTTVDMDGEKIVATYNYSGTKLTSVTSSDNSFSYNLTYTGDNITKIIYRSVDDMGTEITNTQNLSYTGGKLTKSEGNSTSGGGIIYVSSTTYTYNSDKIKSIVTKIKDETNTEDLYNLQTDYTFSGNNVSAYKYTLKTVISGPVTVTPIIFDMSFSGYDTKKNPLGNLPTAFKLVSSHFDVTNNIVYSFSANNYKTSKITTNAESLTSNMSYVYDADAYPTIGTSAYGTVTFEYVK